MSEPNAVPRVGVPLPTATGGSPGHTIIVGAGAVVIAAGIRGSTDFIAPVFLALVLTVAAAPVGTWARRRGAPGWLATTGLAVTVYAFVLTLLGGVTWSIIELATVLPTYVPEADELNANVNEWMTSRGLDDVPVDKLLSQFDLGAVTDALGSLLGAVGGVLSSVVFLVTLLFFMAADQSSMGTRSQALRVVRPELAWALSNFVIGTRKYLIVTAVFGAIVAVLDTVGLWLLGVPLALTWGLLSFLTNFIPNIGFVIGVIPPALLALLDQGWTGLVSVLLLYSVLNVVIQSFIQPRYVGDAVGLSVTATFLSLALWTFLLGALGALLAVPLTLLAKAILIDAQPSARWASVFIASPPDVPVDPDVRPVSPPGATPDGAPVEKGT